MPDVLDESEVAALLEFLEGKELAEEDRKKHRQWLEETSLSDEQKLTIEFLTKVGRFALVRWNPATKGAKEHFTAYEDMGSVYRLVHIDPSNLYTPLHVLMRWEMSEHDSTGLQGELAFLMQKYAAITLQRLMIPEEKAHSNNPKWLKNKSIELMRLALGMEELKKEWIDKLLTGKSKE